MGVIKRFIFAVLLVSLLFSVSGCLFGGSKSITYRGTAVDKNDLAKVKTGETTKSELISLVGGPNATWTSKDKKIEKLTYSRVKTTKGRSSLLFIFSVHDTTVDTDTLVFTLKDGVVDSFQKK